MEENGSDPDAEVTRAMPIELRSRAFDHDQPIPTRYTQDGDNISPDLHWTGVPSATEELALIVDDPDAPYDEPYVHWVIYKIPGDVDRLPEAIAGEREPAQPAGVLQGANTKGGIGWIGPRPPEGHGVHHYRFHLYALDRPLEVDSGLDKKALLGEMEGHVIESTEFVGTYER